MRGGGRRADPWAGRTGIEAGWGGRPKRAIFELRGGRNLDNDQHQCCSKETGGL